MCTCVQADSTGSTACTGVHTTRLPDTVTVNVDDIFKAVKTAAGVYVNTTGGVTTELVTSSCEQRTESRDTITSMEGQLLTSAQQKQADLVSFRVAWSQAVLFGCYEVGGLLAQ